MTTKSMKAKSTKSLDIFSKKEKPIEIDYSNCKKMSEKDFFNTLDILSGIKLSESEKAMVYIPSLKELKELKVFDNLNFFAPYLFFLMDNCPEKDRKGAKFKEYIRTVNNIAVNIW